MTEEVANQPSLHRSLASGVILLGQRVERIERIAQSKGSFALLGKFEPQTLKVITKEPPATYVFDGDRLTVLLDFGFEAHSKSETGGEVREAPSVEVAASFAIVYKMKLEEGFVPSEEELAQFAEINGRFNATSYWREFLHNSLVRAGLPPYYAKPFNAAERMRALDGGNTD